jgi:hypothetical protein
MLILTYLDIKLDTRVYQGIDCNLYPFIPHKPIEAQALDYNSFIP